jgi:hypothetical protein
VDAPLTGVIAEVQATEGMAFSGTVAIFHDADPTPDISDMQATIYWADGSIDTAAEVSLDSSTVTVCQGSGSLRGGG